MKSIIQTNVQARVEEEAGKTSLIDTYGNIIGWMKVLADWVLAPCGAVLDGLVLFGIFYLAIKNIYAAAVLAIAAAISIQFLYGKPAAVAASTAFSGRYSNKGEQGLMWMLSGITVLALSGSLFLSFQSDKLVEAVGEHIYTQESDEEIQARYDGLAYAATEQYNADVATTTEQIEMLQRDKIFDKGKYVTRWNASKNAATLSAGLATQRQQYDNRLQQIEQQRQQALQQLGNKNSNTATLFATRVAEGGNTLRGINIAFNLVRAFIILIFVYFATAAAEEMKGKKAATSPATRVDNPATQQQHPATQRQHYAPAATATPQPRNPIKPFSGRLPTGHATQHATRVDNTATATQHAYNVTVVNGRPTLPWKYSTTPNTAQLTLSDVKKRIGIIESRKPTDNNRQQLAELKIMRSALENI